jgi:hypothetical protein
MVPELSNPKWKLIVNGNVKYSFSTFTMRATVSRVRIAYKLNKVTLDEATFDLYNSCKKNFDLLEQDINILFNN